MRILVLGGTRFIGPPVVERLRDHEVTLFHRGETGNDLFPDLPRIRGDRRTVAWDRANPPDAPPEIDYAAEDRALGTPSANERT